MIQRFFIQKELKHFSTESSEKMSTIFHVKKIGVGNKGCKKNQTTIIKEN